MNYREFFYKKYTSSHTQKLYGVQSLQGITKEFPVWKRYFGRFLKENTSISILDLGCGNGGFVYWLHSLGFTNAEGVDVSDEQVREATRLNISDIILNDAVSFLETKKNTYDLIIARDFLEHFTKDELANLVPAIFSALKDKGRFIAQTVNAESLLGSRLRYADITHEIAFTRSSIFQLFRTFGFSDVEVYPMRPVVRGPVSLVRYIVWRLFEFALHLYLLSATGYRKGIFTQDLLCSARKV